MPLQGDEPIAGDEGPAGRPVYELTIGVSAHDVAALDDWLEQFIAGVLDEPGFVDAEIGVVDGYAWEAGRALRFHVADDAQLQAFLDGSAAATEQRLRDRFGEHAEVTARALRGNLRISESASKHEQCRNCGAVLTGQYCGQCGQRARSRLISLWELLRDSFGDLLDLDSRLWCTLRDLAFHPGRLTSEYLRGRRARYLPPFRTYLVMSVVFFLVAFFDPRGDFARLLEPPIDADVTQSGLAQPAAEPGSVEEPPASETTEPPTVPPAPASDEPSVHLSFNGQQQKADCELDEFDDADIPEVLAGVVTRERIEAICRRFTPTAFVQHMLDILPTGLFILLPLMALVLKLLYPLSRRYYVEHLLLVVHFHAFVFLTLTVAVLLSRLGSLIEVLNAPMILTVVALSFYIPVYLYKSLRRIYRQGHWLTSYKYLLLVTAYIAGLSMLAAISALIAVLSV